MSILQNVIASRTLFLRCCAVILACAAGLAAVLNTFDAWHLAALPFEMNYEEGNILNAALRIVNGLSPYPDPHAFPNVLNPYGPVFYYLVAIPVRVAGAGLLLPRLMVIIAALMAAICIGLLIRKEGQAPALAIAAGCLFIASPLVYFWMPLLRADLLGLALTLAGMCVFRSKHWRWSVPLFVLALFVKVTLLAGPAAGLAFMIARRQWRRAAWFAAAGLAGILCVFGMAQWLTHGWFSFHIFKTHGDPFSWRLVAWNLGGMVKLDFPLVVLSVCYLAIKGRDRDLSLPALYLLFAALATVTSGKLGSDSNHLLELHAALTLTGSLALASLVERIPHRWLALSTAAGATALLVFVSERNPRVIDERAMLRDCGQVYAFVQRTRGEVLADNVGMLVLTHKPVVISNPFVYRYLVAQGWPDTELRNRVQSRGFAAIVLSSNPLNSPLDNSQRWSAGVLDDIKQNYVPVGHFQCTEANTVLLPAKSENVQ